MGRNLTSADPPTRSSNRRCSSQRFVYGSATFLQVGDKCPRFLHRDRSARATRAASRRNGLAWALSPHRKSAAAVTIRARISVPPLPPRAPAAADLHSFLDSAGFDRADG